MARFNTVVKTGAQSPIKSVTKTVRTGNGAVAFARDIQSELFLLAVSNFVGKDTYYENAQNRDDRFSMLSRQVAVENPQWMLQFIGWLRNDAFMRTASIVAAVEAGDAYRALGMDRTVNWSRMFVAASMARADEPGEVLGYYQSKYGRNFPAWMKKGVADGAKKLYNEYSFLKYDTDSKNFRFADVIQLTHARADLPTQNDLFKYALDSRYGNGGNIPDSLEMIPLRSAMMSVPVAERRSYMATAMNSAALGGKDMFKAAGMTWEALSGWLQGPMDAAAWQAVIPSMGYMALLRNLRNFDQAGISDEAKDFVIAKLMDPAQVAKSKQFPSRFLAAYNANKDSLTWASALERALQHSLSNVPSLPGKTLILVDRSGSMFGFGRDGELSDADQAAIFGSALALRAENATLVQYGTSSRVVDFRKGDSVLKMLNKFTRMGGTNTVQAVRNHLQGHDRVVIVTDEQYSYTDPATAVPAKTPLYTWNLVGYAAGGKSGSNKRHTFGGLTDKAFNQIPMIEAGQNAVWPWETK